MKKYILILISCILLGITGTSCTTDFLNMDPPSQVSIEEYYNSDARIFEALVAAYDPLKWIDYAWGQYTHIGFVSDVMSDDVYVGGENQHDCIYLHRMFNYNALPTSVVSDLWTTFYSGVNRANVVLENIENVKDISDEKRALYSAEAKVLRSFYYTWLWKLWGNIPYYEKNLSFPYVHEQSKADDVYTGIVTALEDAIDNGGLDIRTSAQWYGRVSKAMAYMLYAEVVMYQQDESRYPKALAYMEEIIESRKYSLVNDFASIWEEAGEWNSESIFEINYVSVAGKRAWDAAIAAGGSVYPKLIGIDNLGGSPHYEGGWGFEPVREEAYQMYDASDKRRDGSILNFADYAASTGATYKGRYQDTGYFLRKYLPRVGGNTGNTGAADMNYNNNFRVYRYAETLLYASELLARGTSGKGTAQGYLNEVRSRAGLSPIAPTVDNIIQERRLEFVGEGKRYWDLIRSGKAATVLVPDGKYRTKSWTPNKKYLPIPQSDIDAAQGLLTQNNY